MRKILTKASLQVQSKNSEQSYHQFIIKLHEVILALSTLMDSEGKLEQNTNFLNGVINQWKLNHDEFITNDHNE